MAVITLIGNRIARRKALAHRIFLNRKKHTVLILIAALRDADAHHAHLPAQCSRRIEHMGWFERGNCRRAVGMERVLRRKAHVAVDAAWQIHSNLQRRRSGHRFKQPGGLCIRIPVKSNSKHRIHKYLRRAQLFQRQIALRFIVHDFNRQRGHARVHLQCIRSNRMPRRKNNAHLSALVIQLTCNHEAVAAVFAFSTYNGGSCIGFQRNLCFFCNKTRAGGARVFHQPQIVKPRIHGSLLNRANLRGG